MKQLKILARHENANYYSPAGNALASSSGTSAWLRIAAFVFFRTSGSSDHSSGHMVQGGRAQDAKSQWSKQGRLTQIAFVGRGKYSVSVERTMC